MTRRCRRRVAAVPQTRVADLGGSDFEIAQNRWGTLIRRNDLPARGKKIVILTMKSSILSVWNKNNAIIMSDCGIIGKKMSTTQILGIIGT